ncbi:MAG: HAMP domain-containing sensor histidine kinase [Ferruginibacter sp.]
MQNNHSIYGRLLKESLWLLLTAAWFITISFIIDNYWSANSSAQTVEKKLATYIQGAENDFGNIAADSSLLYEISSNRLPEDRFKHLLEKKYFLFFYNPHRQLQFWTTQAVLPDSSIIYSARNIGFSKLPNGYFVWKKEFKHGVLSVALIPVKWNYIVTTDYLRNTFAIGNIANAAYDISFQTAGETAVVKSSAGLPLFSIVEKGSGGSFRNNDVSVWFRLAAALLVLLVLQLYASWLVTEKGLLRGIGFLALCIFVLRLVSYYLPIPLNLRQFELFDPVVYGSSAVHRSLGDLLLNVLMALWFITFVRHHLLQKIDVNPLSAKLWQWLVMVFASTAVLAATFTGSNIIRSLVADSQISFDVINFFSLNFYSVIGFIVLCSVGIGYYFLCQVVFFLLKKLTPRSFLKFFLLTAVLGLFFLSFKVGALASGYQIYLLAWLLLLLYLYNSDGLNIITSRFVTSKIVFWIFFFSISIAAVIIIENDRKELRNRQHYAEILATKSDPTGETLLNSMLTDFRADFLADNFFRFRKMNTAKVFKDSLLNNNFSGYTNKYDTKIFTYGSHEEPLFNSEPASFNQLNSILNTQARPTGIRGLYYYDESFDRFSYISKKTIVDSSRNLVGYVFILVHPKNSSAEKLSPELFSKGIDNSIESSSAYATAIYKNGKLISSHNDYSFPTKLPDGFVANYRFYMENRKSHNELWYNPGNEKIIVIAKRNDVGIESITLFSYLFGGFLLLSAAFWFLSVLMRARLKPGYIADELKLSIRNQIHGTIIFFSILSFFIIGIATILFFISRYESNNREKLSTTIRIMERDLKKSISASWLINDTLKMAGENNYETAIRQIADIHGVDVNLYDLEGDLKVSSLPLPYLKGIVSTRMDPAAYYHLGKEKEVQYFQKEQIGRLRYLSNYVPVIDSAGNERAYLNIPYFTSQSKLKQEISNFLVTIINLNAFIFLIAGIVALFITNRITNTFSLIGEKMKRIHLGTRNERIEWHRNDEIGSLVNEYNKMVDKLEESAHALAKTEREGAWKEMARQVAHEIKNPLTPMKLSMQFLQKSIATNAPNVKELTDKVANTLVEQIDHLSTIANEFSQFANIENASKEKTDINESLRSIQLLYTGNSEAIFNWELLAQPVYIYADKTHINRLFTNLILNGLQAVPEARVPQITVSEELAADHVLIKVSDNGTGISPELEPRIFTPNFTTKSSGTGLGLAMCKRIIEQKNGEIYFETSAEEGTTFFVKIPLYQDT